MEAVVKQVSHVEAEQAHSVRQAIADGGVNDPEPIATMLDLTRRGTFKVSHLIDVGGLQSCPEA
jgi:hypothetical protein